ncbi:MAG: hypothetical protein ACXW61_15985 [Gemmatirosa sp.]
MLSRHSFGILGAMGVLVLAFWLFGWAVLGWHDGFYHTLVPIGIALLAVQYVRRLNLED